MLAKILNYVKIGLVTLSAIIVVLFASDKISLDSLINFSLGLVVLLIASTIVTAGINTVENPKSSVVFLVGLGILIVFYFIGLGMSTDAIDPKTDLVIPGSKQAEAGIYVFYFLVFSAIGVILLSSAQRIRTLF